MTVLQVGLGRLNCIIRGISDSCKFCTMDRAQWAISNGMFLIAKASVIIEIWEFEVTSNYVPNSLIILSFLFIMGYLWAHLVLKRRHGCWDRLVKHSKPIYILPTPYEHKEVLVQVLLIPISRCNLAFDACTCSFTCIRMDIGLWVLEMCCGSAGTS